MLEKSLGEPGATQLRLTEIFYSLQGESITVGLPTVFIRLTGCPLRCQYCDTSYAFKGGRWWAISDILTEVKVYQPRYVTVTGGEPLAQPHCLSLLRMLCDEGYLVSLETSGALSIAGVDPRVSCVMDIKTPGSREVSRNHLENLAHLSSKDQVKFVICDEQDYRWCKDFLNENALPTEHVLLSPSAEQLPPEQLASWILADNLPVRMQLQLHKIIWGNKPGV